MKWDIVAILSCFLLGIYMIFSPFLLGVDQGDLFKTFAGVALMIVGIGVFYNKNIFSPNINKFLLIYSCCVNRNTPNLPIIMVKLTRNLEITKKHWNVSIKL